MKYFIIWLGMSSFSLYAVHERTVLKRAHVLPTLSSSEQVTRALQRSVNARNVEAAHVAITLGADMNAHDSITGYTPLITAISYGDVAMVRELLACGADCSTCDSNGNNVHYHTTMIAQEKKQQSEAIVNTLKAYEHGRQ